MSETQTAHLKLPYLAAAQAQKHVTHNEALARLDAVTQLAVLAAATAPPAEPEEGDRYRIAATATGAWAGKEGQVAAWLGEAWTYLEPEPGWLLFDGDEESLLVFSDGGWQPAGGFLGSFDRLGINAAADATNRLAVRSAAVLFTAVEAGSGGSGDVRFTINKEAAADSATLLFQSGWSGRAEIGLAGDDDFVFKVSADGSDWTEAIRIDRATGLAAILYDNGSSGLAAETVQAAIDELAATGGGGAVASVFGRTGAVTPAAGDYEAGEVGYDNGTSGLAATDVQAAVDELAAEKADAAGLAAVATSGAYADLGGLPTLGALAAEDEVGTAVIAAGAVTNAKLADMAEARLKGRAAGAGTGAPADLTGAEATAMLAVMAGDAGSGGAKGLVPAPAAGDAAANKVLGADGTWRAPLQLLQADEFTSSGTFTPDARAVLLLVQVVGGGAGGAAGAGGDSSANRAGGQGGGAGGVAMGWLHAGEIGGSVSVTVGASAAGGVSGVDSGNGATGNPSAFGSHLAAVGGGRGSGASGLGYAGVSWSLRIVAGTSFADRFPGQAGGGGSSGNGSAATRGGPPQLNMGPGGGGGGAGNATGGTTGNGGAGGAGHNGAGGGLFQQTSATIGGGGAGGAGGSSPANGTTPGDAASPGCGDGGGGGGSTVTASTNGGNGGDGASPGGGGGGGGACRNGATPGNGGAGARGVVRVWQYG